MPPTLWSKVSSELLTDATNSSASRAGTTTGQLRCAAYVGSWNQTASSSHTCDSSSSAGAGVAERGVEVDGGDPGRGLGDAGAGGGSGDPARAR